MKKRVNIFGVVCLAVLALPVRADVRVLFKFDYSGHHIHRVVYIKDREALPKVKLESVENGNLPTPTAIGSGRLEGAVGLGEGLSELVPEGFARLTWFGINDQIVAITQVPDPRVTHSPSHIEGNSASKASLSSGAWLATGPDKTVRISVVLGAHSVLILPQEQWDVELKRE